MNDLLTHKADKTKSSQSPKVFITDLKAGQSYTNQTMAVEEIQQHTTRSGEPYYRLTLQDKSGEIGAKIWKDSFPQCAVQNLIRGTVVNCDFEVQEYNQQPQAIITKLTPTKDYDLGDLIQTSDKDLDSMWKRLLEYSAKIKDKHLKQLVDNLLSDETISKQLKYAPGAEKVHHDFIGGLVEHILEMLDFAQPVLKAYPTANPDLVTAGIILHDIGKIDELERQKTVFIRTKPGYLIGHLLQGFEIIINHMPKDIPEETKIQIIHILASHHGEPEFGAVVRPATIEAAIVSHVDNLSTKSRIFDKEIKAGKFDDLGFSEYNKYLSAKVYGSPSAEEND